MKRTTICIIAALSAMLAIGAMAGCSSQPASSASASGESSASASASEKSPVDILAELKDSLENVPAYKSVTMTEEMTTWTNEDEDAEESSSASAESSGAASSKSAASNPTEDILEATTIYKFDASGDKMKTSMEA